MQTINALISDLDDTLLTENHQMTPYTEKTLKRLLRQGVKVILASGRSAASIRRFAARIETPYPYIAYNGAQIVDPKTDAKLLAHEIPPGLAREVLLFFEQRGVYAQYYNGEDWFYAGDAAFAADYAVSTGIVGTRVIGKLSDAIDGPTPKLLGVESPERVIEIIEAAREVFGDVLTVTTSKPYFIEVTSPEATKGNAVRALADMIGLRPETTVCAGDSLNDLSMLDWSHMPVTVSNAREEVKRVAWRIAEDGHRDGIARLMDTLIPEV